MNNVEFIGFFAGIMVAVSMIPQVIKSRKTKSTKDISIAWSFINFIGQILWIIYGLYINSISLMVMSLITLIMNVFMIIMKIKFD